MEEERKCFKNIEEVITNIMDQTDEDSMREIVKKCKDADDFGAKVHHTFGRQMRNELNLWHPESADLKEDIWNHMSPEKQKFYADWWKGKGDHQGRTMHADDASGELMNVLWDVMKERYSGRWAK